MFFDTPPPLCLQLFIQMCIVYAIFDAILTPSPSRLLTPFMNCPLVRRKSGIRHGLTAVQCHGGVYLFLSRTRYKNMTLFIAQW